MIVRSEDVERFCWAVDVHTSEPESDWIRTLAEITRAAQARILSAAKEREGRQR